MSAGVINFDWLVSTEKILSTVDVDPNEDYFIIGKRDTVGYKPMRATEYPIWAIRAGDIMGYNLIQDEGSDLPKESILNFIGPNVQVIDEPGNNRTNVNITPGTAAMISYTPTNPAAWALPLPTTVQEALDRIANNIPPITPIP